MWNIWKSKAAKAARSGSAPSASACDGPRLVVASEASVEEHPTATGYITEDELRATFTPAARRLADQLRDSALTLALGGESGCGHDQVYRLAADAPLPALLKKALTGADMTAPEGPWPEFGRTQHRIDWPTLIEAHPEILVSNDAMLEGNSGADWASITAAYRLLEASRCDPQLDVSLWVEPDGRVSVEPIALLADDDTSADLSAQVDLMLVVGGRPYELLHYDDEPGMWLLEA